MIRKATQGVAIFCNSNRFLDCARDISIFYFRLTIDDLPFWVVVFLVWGYNRQKPRLKGGAKQPPNKLGG